VLGIWASDDRKYVIDAPGLSGLHKSPGAGKRPGHFFTRIFAWFSGRKIRRDRKPPPKKKPGAEPGFQ
jgi:hypothetical protein